MTVTAMLGALADHLDGALPGNPSIGPVEPASNGDLPAVALSLADIEPTLPAIGRMPAPVRTGALQVDTSVDLADPVLRLPGEDVTLLSPDRRLLQLPHGGIVRADGSDLPPFGVADLLVRRGATTFTPVTGTPGTGEYQPDPVTGALTFGSPLPATGTLTLRYFVGAWEVAVERYAGVVTLDAFASSAAAAVALSDQVVELLAGGGVSGVRRLDPLTVGPVVAAGFGNARRRRLTYRFQYEREIATIRTSGGPIRTVAVDAQSEGSPTETATESFIVPPST